ncbi:MAG: glycoside hydrolase family 43 protein [Armatimonadetes bacterium]|nr:glycoside hydrolase family 43 protein [Armatimonadota bacterium]
MNREEMGRIFGVKDSILVLAYFRTSAEALHLAWSTDGLNWMPLHGNRPVLWATVGNRSIRDPFIRRGADGHFHLVSTDSWMSKNLIYTHSQDLIRWEPQRLVPVMGSVPGARNVWAPEFVCDASTHEYLLFWASITEPGNHQRIWACRTRDFQRFSQPVVLFDPDYTVIDATIVRNGRTWVMVYKDERGRNEPNTDNKAMRMATASSLNGPYGMPTGLITPHLTEGPAVFRVNGRWLMLYDYFLDGKWGASASDDLKSWRPVTENLSVPPGARHGTVFEITRRELDVLQRAWPA